MSNVFTTLGTTLGIVADVPADLSDDPTTGYPSLTYVLVGEVGSIGEFGGTRQIAEFTPVDTGIVAKRAGSINYGDMALNLARDATDAGQIVLQDGLDGTTAGDVHSVELTDANGDKLYFTAIVSQFTYNPDNADAIFKGATTLAVSSKPVPVAAV